MHPASAAVSEMKSCPKCGYEVDAHLQECPHCLVIFEKVARAEERRQERVERTDLGESSSTDRFAAADRLLIKQATEKWEIFVGIETPNRYSVMDGQGNILFHAGEESGSWAQLIGRLFLKAARPFTIHIAARDGEPILRIERPFRFFFHEVSVSNTPGECLGVVRRQFSLVNRRYTVRTNHGGEVYELFGPLFRPWTFKILRHRSECGVIRKKWSGLLKEMFSDADSFGIDFPKGIDSRLKAVFLGAVFLIDFAHFEDNQRN